MGQGGVVVPGVQCPVAVRACVVHLGQRRRHRQVVIEGRSESSCPATDFDCADPVADTVQEFLDAGVGLHRVLQCGLGELQHRPVVRTAQVVAQLGGPNPLQHSRNGQYVAQRLAHLLATHGHPAVVQPEPGEAVAGGTRLRDLVLVMREDQVHAAAMDVELGTEILVRHRDTLRMPARPAPAPGRGPGRLTRLGALPQGEVALVALTARHALALVHVVDPVPGQRTVLGEAQHVEVHVPGTGVSVSGVDQTLDEFHDLGDVSGGARFIGRWQYPQRVVGGRERPLVGGRPLPPRPARRGGLVQDLVVDVGDVADERDVVALGRQPAAQHIERDAAAHMADVGQTLHGGAAQIDGGVAGTDGDEFAHGTGHGVV